MSAEAIAWSNYETAAGIAAADWYAAEATAHAAYAAAASAADATWTAAEAIASTAYDTAATAALTAWQSAESTAWSAYSSAADSALTAWTTAEATASATYDSAASTATTAWNSAESSAWTTYETAASAALTAWTASESTAWTSYESDVAAAVTAWESVATAAQADYAAAATAAESAWNVAEAAAWSTYTADTAAADSAWESTNATASAAYEFDAGDVSGDQLFCRCDPIARQAAVASETHVAFGVSDNGTLVGIDGQFAQSFFDHPRLGLSAAADDFQLCHLPRLSAIRVMRAVVNSIEVRAVLPEFLLQSHMNFIEVGLATLTACDDRLIGHDHGKYAGSIQTTDGRTDSWQQFNLLGPVEISDVAVDRPVSVEKERRFECKAARDSLVLRHQILPINLPHSASFAVVHGLPHAMTLDDLTLPAPTPHIPGQFSSGRVFYQFVPEGGDGLAVVPLEVEGLAAVGDGAGEDRFPGAVVIARVVLARRTVAPVRGERDEIEHGGCKVTEFLALLPGDVTGH